MLLALSWLFTFAGLAAGAAGLAAFVSLCRQAERIAGDDLKVRAAVAAVSTVPLAMVAMYTLMLIGLDGLAALVFVYAAVAAIVGLRTCYLTVNPGKRVTYSPRPHRPW